MRTLVRSTGCAASGQGLGGGGRVRSSRWLYLNPYQGELLSLVREKKRFERFECSIGKKFNRNIRISFGAGVCGHFPTFCSRSVPREREREREVSGRTPPLPSLTSPARFQPTLPPPSPLPSPPLRRGGGPWICFARPPRPYRDQ